MPDEPVSAGEGWRQIWFAATAATVLVGLAIQVGVVATNDAVAVLFLGVSAGATALDARLPRPASECAAPDAELRV